MTLSRGDHLVKWDPAEGKPVPDEPHYELIEMTPMFQSRDTDGEFGHEDQILLVRKVQ